MGKQHRELCVMRCHAALIGRKVMPHTIEPGDREAGHAAHRGAQEVMLGGRSGIPVGHTRRQVMPHRGDPGRSRQVMPQAGKTAR